MCWYPFWVWVLYSGLCSWEPSRVTLRIPKEHIKNIIFLWVFVALSKFYSSIRKISDVQTYFRMHLCLAENGRCPGVRAKAACRRQRLTHVLVSRKTYCTLFVEIQDPRTSKRNVSRELKVSQMFVQRSKVIRRKGLFLFVSPSRL